MSSDLLAEPHAHDADALIEALDSSRHGLSLAEAQARLQVYGRNELPRARPPGVGLIFLRQFVSPLIYILFAAAALSLLIQEWSDAVFIFAVLLINAVIGTVQEYSAQQSATALQNLVTTFSRVIRDGDSFEIPAAEVVPGDLVLLEGGDRVTADIRLLTAYDLEVDESLLTGESLPVRKEAGVVLPPDTPLGDRRNMVFAGSLVMRGQAQGIAVHTGLQTELGEIARDVVATAAAEAPLQVRMRRFTHRVALAVGIAAVVLAIVTLLRGYPYSEVFLLAVALAVSAIPEGLPVALTVALAVGLNRMARRNVIVRRLIAVEALGSCTCIATDKTGTLTVNQLTVQKIFVPPDREWQVTGEGIDPRGTIVSPEGGLSASEQQLLLRLARAAALPNDGFLGQRQAGWVAHGDAVDVAMLVLAHKAGIVKAELAGNYPELAALPFDSARLYAASLNQVEGQYQAFVKGATERLLEMCSRMATPTGDVPIDRQRLEQQARTMAQAGYRVLALAAGPVETGSEDPASHFGEEQLRDLTFLGLVGMLDPLRPEAKAAIAACDEAGIKVVMVTGDHPATALVIARELGLAETEAQVVTGRALRQAATEAARRELIREARVFARVEPRQKLEIVQGLQALGHFVAVTGDGANDAPALHAAEVGVAMGKSGTEVAREAADLIITDDNFSSLVAGIEEGRIAYNNVRKVIFLLVSTGAAELVLFGLALFSGLPLPLLAVQLLWLNLVTNGIQDVALAFEPAEGRELQQRPRPPHESIFNRIMLERVIVSALFMGVLAFVTLQWLLERGYSLEQARNGVLLLMVLFENIHAFNSRSETLSVFRHNPLRNKILLIGAIAAQLVHIGAMYTPWLRDVLQIQPVSPEHWLELLGLATGLLLVMEMLKIRHRGWGRSYKL